MLNRATLLLIFLALQHPFIYVCDGEATALKHQQIIAPRMATEMMLTGQLPFSIPGVLDSTAARGYKVL